PDQGTRLLPAAGMRARAAHSRRPGRAGGGARRMIWATRRHCHIDRAACAWLIRRFIDPQAEFLFVDDPDEVPDDATPFVMRGVELSHHDGDCSFETFLRNYDLADQVLWDIAKIVHVSDPSDERFDAPAAHGHDVILIV